jgi:hypothetical protein
MGGCWTNFNFSPATLFLDLITVQDYANKLPDVPLGPQFINPVEHSLQ